MVDPDSDVIDLVANGDVTNALRLLMKRHGAAVYRYCREGVRDASLADDVQQQVFIQVFRDLPGFSSRSTLRTWLFAIARNRVLDAVRSRNRAESRRSDGDGREIQDQGPPASERIDRARLSEALVACLATLPPRVRLALLLRYQQGFTFEDMATICDERPGTLQAQVARALPKLRKCIEQRTGGPL
jgi:RNA polymerase sigma-70 factor (ECF subfamily)